MRKVAVYRNGFEAGILSEEAQGNYVFRYNDDYYNDSAMPSISLTLPKTQREYRSEYLFPFFFNMLSEGVNRKLQSLQWKIDEEDHFGLLMQTAHFETIGAITVKALL